MLVRFWGVRGSTPTPQSENLRYGGNTSCVEVRVNGHIYVFDCGTGFRNLGKQLSLEQSGNGKKGHPINAHIFLSHFHWDHIQGIPFFSPLYDDRNNSFVF
ncbi:MAG TPA: MBL fold metallo-hydrolase, partial [Candidatus Acidoferrum sp.]|nr:MBL fold metallo-hydrolase [Candidatus Acidoferrum sp.]